MLSGILCAEHIAAAIGEGRAHDEVDSYDAAWRSSDIGRDLKRVRNVKPLWSKYGTYVGAPLFGLDMWTNELFGFSFFGTLKHGKADYETLKPVSEVTPIVYPKRASKLVFDKLSSVFVSNTNHEEDQPVHLKLADPAIPIERNLPDLWRAGSALLPGGRLRSGLCRRSDAPRSALRDQCAKLRSLQNLRHQGPGAKYHLGPPGGRRRTELSEYVTGAAQAPALREANGPRRRFAPMTRRGMTRTDVLCRLEDFRVPSGACAACHLPRRRRRNAAVHAMANIGTRAVERERVRFAADGVRTARRSLGRAARGALSASARRRWRRRTALSFSAARSTSG